MVSSKEQSQTARIVSLEEALRSSEGRYSTLVNCIDAAFCIIEILFDASGHAIDYRFIEVNPAFEINTGLRAVIGRTIRELVPAIEDHWITTYARVARSQQSERFENHALALSDRWYEVNAVPIGAPELHRVGVIFSDISEKRKMDSALRVSESRLDHAMSIAALGTFDWNTATHAITLSARSREMFGFNAEDAVTSEEIIARIEPKDYAYAQEQALECLRSGKRRTVTYRVNQPDGRVRHVKSVSDVATNDPARVRFIGVLEDITLPTVTAAHLEYLNAVLKKAVAEKTRITEALYIEKERAEVTLNSIGDAVICTDVSGAVTYLNSAAERLTGWSRETSVGKPLEAVFHIIDTETRALIPNPMWVATQENKVVGLPPSCTLVRRDGSEIPIEDSAAPIHDRKKRVTGAVMVFHDVSASHSLAIKLAHAAQHDELTDLPNRNLLNDRLAVAISAAARRGSPLALLYLDVDRFKNINDSLGHAVGDRLLQAVAHRLTERVRATDTVSRQGGDEFVVLLAEVAHAEDAAICADKILQRLRQPYLIDEHEIHISSSLGLAIYPQDGDTAQTLLQNADSAMYEAKARGRNNFQFYREDLNASASQRQTLESALRHAIERMEFELHYQPIMDIKTGVIAGVEALIRWRHPEEGFLLPARFIPIAEESGLIVEIGAWVLDEACRKAQAWKMAGLPDLRLAVNISAVELRSPGFVSGVSASLRETGFDPTHLEFELTETFLMQDSKSTAKVLGAIKALGIHLALDDFGTGYSSLSYMRRFPIDALKIDRSFVNGVGTDVDDASVVSAVINMGRSLHKRVVAEGVETMEQLSFLGAEGCTEAQGYFFSRPLDAAGIERLIGDAEH